MSPEDTVQVTVRALMEQVEIELADRVVAHWCTMVVPWGQPPGADMMVPL